MEAGKIDRVGQSCNFDLLWILPRQFAVVRLPICKLQKMDSIYRRYRSDSGCINGDQLARRFQMALYQNRIRISASVDRANQVCSVPRASLLSGRSTRMDRRRNRQKCLRHALHDLWSGAVMEGHYHLQNSRKYNANPEAKGDGVRLAHGSVSAFCGELADCFSVLFNGEPVGCHDFNGIP